MVGWRIDDKILFILQRISYKWLLQWKFLFSSGMLLNDNKHTRDLLMCYYYGRCLESDQESSCKN